MKLCQLCRLIPHVFPFQMENSRKSYESATQQLVSFLEHVTTMLQATSPTQRKLFEATKVQNFFSNLRNVNFSISLVHIQRPGISKGYTAGNFTFNKALSTRDGTRVGTGTGKPEFLLKIQNPGFQNQNPRTRVLELY